jgi:hypothetical protein
MIRASSWPSYRRGSVDFLTFRRGAPVLRENAERASCKGNVSFGVDVTVSLVASGCRLCQATMNQPATAITSTAVKP